MSFHVILVSVIVMSPLHGSSVGPSLSRFEGPSHGLCDRLFRLLHIQSMFRPINADIAIIVVVVVVNIVILLAATSNVKDGNIVFVSIVGICLIVVGDIDLLQRMCIRLMLLIGQLFENVLDLIAECASFFGIQRHNDIIIVLVTVAVAVTRRIDGARHTGE